MTIKEAVRVLEWKGLPYPLREASNPNIGNVYFRGLFPSVADIPEVHELTDDQHIEFAISILAADERVMERVYTYLMSSANWDKSEFLRLQTLDASLQVKQASEIGMTIEQMMGVE